jgi:uncharacterized protein (TIGR02996 family)
MNDQKLLLDAILKFPDEDAPRLMYADEIRANGDIDRAEFIQLQIALERGAPDDPTRPEMVARKNELLRLHGDLWAAEVADPHVNEVRFRRGFVEDMETTARRFISKPEWSRRVPLRVARLSRAAGSAVALTTTPNFAGLEALVIHDDRFGDDDLTGLVASAGTRLTALMVSGRSPFNGLAISNRGVGALAGSGLLGNLTTLALGTNGTVGSAALRMLAVRGGGLRHLQLVNTDIGDHGARLIADGVFPNLVSLCVYGSRIGDAGLRALIRAPGLPNLRRLSLRSGALTDAGLLAVARSAAAARLDRLELDRGLGGTFDTSPYDEIRQAHPQLEVVEDWSEFTMLGFDEAPFRISNFVNAHGLERRPWVGR